MKPRLNPHAALRLPRRSLVPAILAVSLSGGAILSAAEVTFKYFRFTPTDNNPTEQTQVQMSEFSFSHLGRTLPLTGVTVTGGDNAPDGAEGAMSLIDGSVQTKWFNNSRAALTFTFPDAVTIDRYNFATANDSLDRTPISWTLEGSTDGTNYVNIDTRTGVGAPPTLFTFLGAFEVGGNQDLPSLAFVPTITRTSADGVTPEVYTSSPAIVKNGQPVDVNWSVSGTTSSILLNGTPVAALDSQTIVPPANSETDYTLAATGASGASALTVRLRAVPGATASAQYVRFTPAKLRGIGSFIQLGEFEFYNGTTKLTPFTVTSPGGDYPDAEPLSKLTDGDFTSKYLDFNTLPVVFDFGSVQPFDGYQIVTGNDAPERDPVDWTLETSNDGIHWSLLESVTQYPMPTARRAATGLLPISGDGATWTGSAGGTWNLTATNFVAPGTSTPIAYTEGDIVRFPEGAANPSINLPAPLSPGTVEFNSDTTNYTLGGNGFTGPTGVRKQGASTATLSAPSTFTGPIVVGGGTLVAADANALGSADSQSSLELLSGGTLQATVDLTTQRRLKVFGIGGTLSVDEGVTLSKTGQLELNGTLTKEGPGTVRFEGYGGTLATLPTTERQFVINEGTLNFASDYYATYPWNGSSPSILVNENGTLEWGANGALGGHHTLTDAFLQQIKVVGGFFQIDGVLNYIPLGRTADGEGRLTLQGGIVNGGGDFEPVEGTEELGNAIISVLPSDFPSEIAGSGVMAMNPGNFTIDTLAGATLRISRRLSGDYGLDKIGEGELILVNGESTYAGKPRTWQTVDTAVGTNIQAGTLTLENTTGSATGLSKVTVAAGAKLQGGGIATGAAAVAGTIAPGDADFPVATLTLGSTKLTGTLAIEVNGSTADRLAVTGDLDVTGATLNVTPVGGGFTQASYPVATFTGTLTGTFATVTGVPSGYSVAYNAAAKRIEITNGTVPSGYAGWAANLSDPSPEADIDQDGLSNAVEYVLGTSATTPSQASAPSSSYDASGNLVFVFRRSAESAYLNPGVEYSTTLLDGSWTTAPGANVGVEANGFGAGIDKVTVTLPSSLTTSGKLFARLKVVVP